MRLSNFSRNEKGFISLDNGKMVVFYTEETRFVDKNSRSGEEGRADVLKASYKVTAQGRFDGKYTMYANYIEYTIPIQNSSSTARN